MALNVPAGNKKRLTFGPGILQIGASGSTPSTDVGYARGASLSITRQKLDVFQGSPRSLIETYAVQEDVALNFTGIEWAPFNLVRALGSGVTSGTGTETLGFGGEVTFAEVALSFEHITPTNGTVSIYVWKAQGQGEVTVNFGDDVQEFQYNFRALEATQDWLSNPLNANERLIQINFTPGP